MTTNKRKPNFSDEEIKVLLSSYKERHNTIDGKFSNTLTNNDKLIAWQQITDNVNAVNKKGFIRSTEDMKKKLTTYRSEVKSKAARIYNHQKATGGGSPSKEILSEVEKLVVDSMNEQLIIGINEGIDTEIQIIADNETKSSSSSDPEVIDTITYNEYNSLLAISQTPKTSIKKRKTSYTSYTPNSTSNYAKEMLEIEKQKFELKKAKLDLIKIDLIFKAKQLESNGIDVSEEISAINNMYND